MIVLHGTSCLQLVRLLYCTIRYLDLQLNWSSIRFRYWQLLVQASNAAALRGPSGFGSLATATGSGRSKVQVVGHC